MSDQNHPEDKKRHSRQRIEEVLSELLTTPATPSADGSRKARWRSFQGLWGGQMTRIAAKVGVPRSQREDLIQEVLWRMMARWDEFRRPNGAHEWLALSRKIMRDASVDVVRGRRRHVGQSLPAELIDDRASDPASLAEAKDQHEWVFVNLEELSRERPDYAWMLREHFLKGRPIKELADERGTTEHAVHCCMTRALKVLPRLMSECRPDGEAAP